MEYMPLPPTMDYQDKFIKIATDALDTEVTPQDITPDEVACAEVLSTLIRKVFPDFPMIVSTIELFQRLKNDKRFVVTLSPQRGAIVISPTKGYTRGHCGVFITNERIASNNSFGQLKGKFTGNYQWDSWIKEFINKRGLHTYLFIVK